MVFARLILAVVLLLTVGCATADPSLRHEADQLSEITIQQLGGGLTMQVPYTIHMSGSGHVRLLNQWADALPKVREGRIAWADFLDLVDRLEEMQFFDINPYIEQCQTISDAPRIAVQARIGNRERRIAFDVSCSTKHAQQLVALHEEVLELLHVGQWEPQLRRFIDRPN